MNPSERHRHESRDHQRHYANIVALEAVEGDLKQQNVEAVYCLGDLVGYAAHPNEVIDRIVNERTATIMGNYDDGVGFDRDECGCAYRDPEEQRLGDLSLRWTQRTVTPDRKGFLRSLVPEIRFHADGKRIRLVHGSPRRMNEYLFEDRPLSSFQRLAATSEADVLIFGHTHKPYTKRVDGVLFVNAGSVGKPKDGDPRACYAVVDTAGDVVVEFRRIPYDVAAEAAAIRESSLPDKFAADIEAGGASTSTPASDSGTGA
jgi:putative phosphoesterase